MMQSNVLGFQPTGLGFIAEMKYVGGAYHTRRASGYGICLDSSNNIYVSGAFDNGSYSNAYLAKLNNTGTPQWQKQFVSSLTSSILTRVTTDGTDMYAGGSQGGDPIWIKFNTSGTVSWYKTNSGGGTVWGLEYNSYSGGRLKTLTDDYPVGLRFFDLNTSGSVASSFGEKLIDNTTLTGSHFINNVGGFATSTGGTDPTYNATAYYEYEGGVSTPVLYSMRDDGADFWAREIASTSSSGGMYIGCTYGYDYTAYTRPSLFACGTWGSSPRKAFLTKYNGTGTIQWQRRLDGGYGGRWSSVVCDSSTNIYVVGKYENSSGDEIMMIAKYNSSGTLQWQRTITHSQGFDLAPQYVIHDGSTLYITGFLLESSSYNSLMIFKLPDDGSLTGTYGKYTYAASSLTASTPSVTSQSNSVSSVSASLGTYNEYGFVPSSITFNQTFTAL